MSKNWTRPHFHRFTLPFFIERHPLFLPLLCVIAGILSVEARYISAHSFRQQFFVVIVLGVAAGASLMIPPKRIGRIPLAYLLVMLFFVGFGRLYYSYQWIEPNLPLSRYLGQSYLMEGSVIRDVKVIDSKRAYCWVKVMSIGNETEIEHPKGNVQLFYNPQAIPELFKRDTIEWNGKLKLIAVDTSKKSMFDWLFRHQVFHSCSGKEVRLVSRPVDVFSFLAVQREAFSNKIKRYVLNSDAQALAEAMLIGKKSNLTEELRLSFSQVGLSHLLALSGAHVGVLLLLMFLAHRLFVLLPFGRFASGILIACLLLAFAILTGGTASVVRACGMACLYMVGRSLNRPPNLIQLLSLAAFVHVLIWPEEVHEIGFQLSYSAVLGIALLFVPGRKWLVYKTNRFLKFNTKSKRVRAIKWIVIHAQEVLLISLAAQVYTAPLAIFYFQQFPIYFLLANLLVYPLSFIALFAGFLLLIVGDLPFVGFMLGWVVEKSLISISELAGVVSGFPNAIVQLNFVDIHVAVAVWMAFLLYGIHVSQRANRFSL